MSHHPDATLRRRSLPGGEFAYYELGDPTAPLVVCQHGFPDHPKTFFPFAERLVDAGYRAVMPFLRGYAPSTLHGPYHQKRLGEDLVELSRALSPERAAVLVGHDWGAIATYAAVTRDPHAFRRAVTLAVPHVAAFQRNIAVSVRQQLRSGYMMFFQLPFLPERIVPRNDFAFVDALWKRWSPGYSAAPDYMRELKSCLRASLPAPLGHYRALRTRPPRQKPSTFQPRRLIEVPLLHLHGADDGCIAVEMGAGQDAHFAAEFHSENLPGLGHFLHLEDPDRVACRVLEFI